MNKCCTYNNAVALITLLLYCNFVGFTNCIFLLLAYSMLQGGPLPCFMNEVLINRLFAIPTAEGLTNAEAQLREGLSKFGLIEVWYSIIDCTKHLKDFDL